MPAPESLSCRAAELAAKDFRDLVIPLYFRTDLTLEQQTRQRGKPLPYLRLAAQLVHEFAFKTIVEIGSMREPMRHGLDEFNPYCCNDGHSTLHWAATGADVFTVDVNPRCAAVLDSYRSVLPNLHLFTGDGIAFLARFARTIDLLYLDAWDVIEGADYAERHLEAYRTALPRLAPTCLVQIDDTDILNGGKGRLAIPAMIRDGFELATWGRQAILVRNA
jgi:hypothetical protein